MIVKEVYPIIIGISGISGAGKSTLTKALAEHLAATMLFWDDFDSISTDPKDLVDWYENGRDYTAWDYSAVAEVIRQLKSGKVIEHPVLKIMLQPTKYVIADLPLGRLHKQTGQYVDFFIHLDTPLDIALTRRFLRDYDNATSSKQDMIENLRFYLNETRKLYLTEDLIAASDHVIDGSRTIKEQVANVLSILN